MTIRKITFPFKFQLAYPIANLINISMNEFYNLQTFEAVDYYFNADEMDAILFTYTLGDRFKQINKRLTFTKQIAFHIIAINTIWKHYSTYIELINNIFAIANKTHSLEVQYLQKLFILNHLMIIENLLDKNRSIHLHEISLKEGKEISCNIRRKMWNFYIYTGFFPKDFETAILASLKFHKSIEKLLRNPDNLLTYQHYNVKTEINPFSIDLRKKATRLTKDFCIYYYATLKHYPQTQIDDELVSRFPEFYLREITANDKKNKNSEIRG